MLGDLGARELENFILRAPAFLLIFKQERFAAAGIKPYIHHDTLWVGLVEDDVGVFWSAAIACMQWLIAGSIWLPAPAC